MQKALSFFPGVPIFFFISGFLVYQSFNRNQTNPLNYYRNRALRIFPALIAAAFVCLALLIFSRPELFEHNKTEVITWFVGQISLFQFYTPDALRFWGVGTPNGSLWTISVELQFYLILPLLVILLKSSLKFVKLVVLILVCIGFNYYSASAFYADGILGKALGVSLSSYLFFFLLGIIGAVYKDKIIPFVLKYGLFIVLSFASLVFSSLFWGEVNIGGYWITSIENLIYYILLCLLVFIVAFKTRLQKLTNKLNSHDISYGIYIYHMLVINVLVHHQLVNYPKWLVLTLVVTVLLGYFSWLYIEKPFLSLKKKTALLG